MGVTDLLHNVINTIEDGDDGTFEQYEDVLKNIDQAMESENFNTDFSVKAKSSDAAEKNPDDSDEDEESDENS